MEEYAGVVRDINKMHQQLEHDGAAALKNIASNTDRLLDQQMVICTQKLNNIEAFFRQELQGRKEALAEAEARTAAKLDQARQEMESILNENAELAHLFGDRVGQILRFRKEVVPQPEEAIEPEPAEFEDVPALTKDQEEIVADMQDESKIQLWLKVRPMNDVERSSPAHCIPGYAMLTQ